MSYKYRKGGTPDHVGGVDCNTSMMDDHRSGYVVAENKKSGYAVADRKSGYLVAEKK